MQIEQHQIIARLDPSMIGITGLCFSSPSVDVGGSGPKPKKPAKKAAKKAAPAKKKKKK